MSKRRNSDDVMNNIIKAVERCIPASSLPMNIIDHEDLASELVIELSGTVCLVDKREYDLMVRRLRQLRRYEEAIHNGMLTSPLINLGNIPDPTSN